MSSTISDRLDETPERPDSAGVACSEPGGRAERRAGATCRPGPRPELAEEVKALLPDELIEGERTVSEAAEAAEISVRCARKWVAR